MKIISSLENISLKTQKSISGFVSPHFVDIEWSKPIWIKVNGWWQILPQHQSTYLKGLELASIEIPPLRPKFTYLVKGPLNVSVVK